jgi:hypothetical protein
MIAGLPIAYWLPIVAMPAFALVLSVSWGTLPDTMSVHFAAGGAPDRSISRVVFALQALLVLAMPAAAAPALLRGGVVAAPLSRAVLAGVYGLTAAAFTVLWGIVRFNQHLSGPPRPADAAMAALAGVAIGYALGTWLARERR